MPCGCTEQHNSNCFCQCENLEVPQGPTGLTGATGGTGPAGPAGSAGADGDNAFVAELTNDAAAVSVADITGTSILTASKPVTTFKLREGETDLTINLAAVTVTVGGAIPVGGYTLALISGNARVTLDSFDPKLGNYGYLDIAYLYNTTTYTKRFDIVCVTGGTTFLVGEDDPTAVLDAQEGMELLTASNKLMRYQGGAWIQVADYSQVSTKSVVLTGAAHALNLTADSERTIAVTGTGTVNNNITINLPGAGCAAGTEFKVAYNATMTAGTGVLTVFGIVIPHTLYNEVFSITALFDGSTWIVSTIISAAMLAAYGNVHFSIVPTPGSTTVTYNVIDSKSTEVTYTIDPPLSTDCDIVFYLGDLITDLASKYTRKIHFIVKNKITTDRFTGTPTSVSFQYRRNGSALIIGVPQSIYSADTPYDNINVRYYLERSTGSIVPTTAIFQAVEFYKQTSVIIDYTKLASSDYKDYLAIMHYEKVIWMYDGVAAYDRSNSYV